MSSNSQGAYYVCLKDKIRANFNVSVGEDGFEDKWQHAMIGVACIGNDKKYINGILSRVNNLINSYHRTESMNSNMEIW